MRIERYIFGSVRGYGQLARSSGISQADARLFDTISFSFGQVNDPSFARSLLDRPAFFTYQVPADRWAIVRVLSGHPDDNDRPTLLLIWLVFARQDWRGALGRNPQPLLETPDLWRYDGEPALSVLEITVPPRGDHTRPVLNDRLASLLRGLQHNVATKRSTIASAAEFTAGEIFTMVAAAPPQVQEKMTVAYRCLNNKFPVVLNLIADGTASTAGLRAMAGVSLSETETASDLEAPAFDTDPAILTPRLPITETYMTAPIAKSQSNPLMLILLMIAVVGPIVSYIVAHNQDKTAMIDLKDQVEREFNEHLSRIKNLDIIVADTSRVDALAQTIQKDTDQLKSQDQVLIQMKALSDKRFAELKADFNANKKQIGEITEKISKVGNRSPSTSRPSTSQTTHEGK